MVETFIKRIRSSHLNVDKATKCRYHYLDMQKAPGLAKFKLRLGTAGILQHLLTALLVPGKLAVFTPPLGGSGTS